MGMTAEQINRIKARIKAEMLRRNGKGSSLKKYTPSQANKALTDQGGTSYDFTTVHAGDPITLEHGTKTLNLLVSNVNKNSIFGSKQAKQGSAIPETFDYDKMSLGLSKIEREYFTGETSVTINAKKQANKAYVDSVESSSCNVACSGLCKGSCIGMCNGCKGTCTATCGMGCESGSMTTTNYNGTGTKKTNIDLFESGDWIVTNHECFLNVNYTNRFTYSGARAAYSRNAVDLRLTSVKISTDNKASSNPLCLVKFGAAYSVADNNRIYTTGVGSKTLIVYTQGNRLLVKAEDGTPFYMLTSGSFSVSVSIAVMGH